MRVVVTRAELVANVWDDTNTYSNIIDVYASRLRRKIDEGEKVALFNTLRGTGFLLEAPDAETPKTPARALRRKSARPRG